MNKPLIYLIILCSLILIVIAVPTSSKEVIPLKNTLQEIAINETEIIGKVEGWKCLDYALYYNKTFSEKYPELDVKLSHSVVICGGLENCNSTHIYVLINGYGNSCIVDTWKVACLK